MLSWSASSIPVERLEAMYAVCKVLWPGKQATLFISWVALKSSLGLPVSLPSWWPGENESSWMWSIFDHTQFPTLQYRTCKHGHVVVCCGVRNGLSCVLQALVFQIGIPGDGFENWGQAILQSSISLQVSPTFSSCSSICSIMLTRLLSHPDHPSHNSNLQRRLTNGNILMSHEARSSNLTVDVLTHLMEAWMAWNASLLHTSVHCCQRALRLLHKSTHSRLTSFDIITV